MQSRSKTAVVRWATRCVAAGMMLFWGVFFVQHTWTWFFGHWTAYINRWPTIPPATVWVQQTAVLLLLAGLAVGLRRELAGGLMAIAGAVLLFASISALYVLLISVPGILYLVCWYSARRQRVRLPREARQPRPASGWAVTLGARQPVFET